MTDGLVKEFMSLKSEDKTLRVSIAKEKHERGICFMCSWIVQKIRYDDFPRECRVKHLMLCCHPKGSAA